ncbi:MAG: hypothetical protein CME06_06265 [Gemmatimonadetes bacterium]|nr:hypothetical protein [Gemmatimonadota bacterium]
MPVVSVLLMALVVATAAPSTAQQPAGRPAEPFAIAVEALSERRIDEALRWFQVTTSDFPGTKEALQARCHRIVILAAREASWLLLGNAWHAGMQRTVEGDYSFVARSADDFATQMARYYRARDEAVETLLTDLRRLVAEDDRKVLAFAFEPPAQVPRPEANLAGHLEHGFYLEPSDCSVLEQMLFDDAYAAYLKALLGLSGSDPTPSPASGRLDRKAFYGALMDRIATVIEESSENAHDRETVSRLAQVVLEEGKNRRYDVAVVHAREILARYGTVVDGPIRCRRCGETAKAGWRFCPFDGVVLPAAEIDAPPSVPEG